jgi:hypothetical protein
MNVIFLDIDGVLNSDHHYRTRKKPTTKEEHPYCEIDLKSLNILNEVVKLTDSKVVVSSTWRRKNTLERLREIFTFVGSKFEIFDVTPIKGNMNRRYGEVIRGYEINEWLSNHPDVKNYVILDDDQDFLEEQQPHFIHIRDYNGLNNTHIEKIKNILNKTNNENH